MIIRKLLPVVLLLLAAGCGKAPTATPAVAKVTVMTVSPRDVPIYQEWIGTLDGYPNARISAEVAGYLIKQNYREGATVKQGDLLFEIDPRPFQAVLDQALAKEQQDEAALGKTDLDVKRFTPLARTHAISQQQLDDAVQANLAANAAVVADKAAVETARLNLGFTRIISPVDGVAGVAQAQIGDLVGPSTGVLATVSTVNPIRVYFNISEQFYLGFFRPAGSTAGESLRQEDIPLQLVLADSSVCPSQGKWIITGRQVDSTTGTLQVAGEFDNPNNFLRPGQYAMVRARTQVRKGALLVPQRAVMELQGAWQVAVIDATNTAHVKTVQVGRQIGSDWLIESGLKAGDRVVAEGTQKIKEGTKVEAEEFAPAQADKAPAPAPAAGGKQG
jgi:membrane fusion protein (multidrug efflux system)